ncbi:MAG: hypothetical protein A2900_04545 [Candidatus Chisholmbacteria bacterium RIFCSPLOWO2_01_FULL_50_28]|uniref:Uncharacterized protein n=1 Tax=Candidatus Chisholmbacteria bacterium RIFCSPHIGHO2_01_FULL_52_32 TaxID=1797591 RepID=A0A1G1VSC3_9BACT|nr:MAG: hypothetical protein A2786_02200 [Candidatus Chisholmbacteria bacterium RIFCSPHIGHO2_01_FULL_52_32]OGY20320.1 MAG: hypothetical protein A2900_04545 [Candidatus Chisholmbacteria bacterium RIFCSPLOWO2_01_FULL_50_28]
MSKRKRFVLVSLLLTLGLFGIQFIRVDYRYQAILLLGGLAYVFCGWALSEDLHKIEWLTALTLPVIYPVSVGLFYFLLPERMLSRLIILGIFGVGMYALLLTENIFTVAAIRTIQLLRAARAVGFLLTLVTAFFLFDTIWSFRLPFYANAILVGLASVPLIFQALWSVELTEDRIERRTVVYSLCLSLAIGELALALSFWPVTVSVGSLFLVTMAYVGLGISQYHFSGRLFRRTLYEYLGVGMIVLLTTYLVTKWG